MGNFLVVGGSSGIGKETVEVLETGGNNVFATYRSTEPASGSSTSYEYLDVIEETLSFDFCPESLDGLVYCPGSINLKPFARISPEEFNDDFELQVGGAIKVIQGVLPRLKKAEQSSIVLFSTVAVQTGFNFHTQVSVSKGAIEGLTRSLAAELAPQVRVNCVAPSLTDTPLAAKLLNTDKKRELNAERHPLKSVGKPREIAETAGFLLSEKSSWITGQVIHVDGGISSINQ